MASECKWKTNKHSTITFTLPLSCQICLGKVKQPVLCSNHHVFCQLCMDIWLEKNKQCPTCRIEINEDNPVKNIIGGQLEEEDPKKQSTAELRRARFELLYKEYEDQFEQLRKESIILRTENNILLAQLQEAEDENNKQNKLNKECSSSSSPSNQQNLLMLTKNLQEAQTLYAGIKEEMAQLKQENGKLKDENVNLTRENETLRMEIAQRSPKKFGRYTVATLETKLAEYEKEIRQLKKALERSDEYIEDLEGKINEQSRGVGGNIQNQFPHKEKESHPAKEAVHPGINGHGCSSRPRGLTSEREREFQAKESLLPEKELHAPEILDSAKRILFLGNKSGRDERFESTGVTNSKAQCETNIQKKDSMSGRITDSIMKQKSGKNVHSGSTNRSDQTDKVAKVKKVSFVVQAKSSNDSSTFDLEIPSPLHSLQQEQQTYQRLSETAYEKGVRHPDTINRSDEVDGDVPRVSDFDNHVMSLLKNAKCTNHDKRSAVQMSGKFKDESLSLVTSGGSRSSRDEDVNDSSRLSLPDFDSPRKPSSLDSFIDSPKKWKSSESDDLPKSDSVNGIEHESSVKNVNDTDLDFSMTPEMSDCLRLMDQAERKLELPQQTPKLSDQGLTRSSSLPSYSLSSYSRGQFSAPSFRVVHPAQSFTPAESMKVWEQDFFRGLQANPYKQYNIPQHSASVSVTDNRHPHSKDTDDAEMYSNHSVVRCSPHHAIPALNSGSKTMSADKLNATALSKQSHNYRQENSTYSSLPSSSTTTVTDSTSLNYHSACSRTESDQPSSSSALPSSVQGISHGYHHNAHSSSMNSSLEWPDSISKSTSLSHSNLQLDNSDYVPTSITMTESKRSYVGVGGFDSPRQFTKGYKDFTIASVSSALSKDASNSSLLPTEPKKRIFIIDHEFDLSMPSKTAKKQGFDF